MTEAPGDRAPAPWWARPPLLALLAVVLALPSLGAGWIADDLIHRAVVIGEHPVMHPGASDLFRFSSGRAEDWLPVVRSGYGWWMAKDLRLAFFRPVTAWTHLLDHLVIGAVPWLHHVHSLLWAALAALVVRLLLRRWLPAPIAALAALLWVVDESRWLASTWIAARNANVSLVFAGLGVWAQLRWQQDGWRPGRAWAALGVALGLCAGEAAVGVVALLVGWTLVVDDGEGRAASRSRVRRLLALWPIALVGVAWLGAWVSGDYGARSSAAYLDPLRQPGAVALASLWRLPVLVAAQLGNVPPDITATMATTRPVVAAIGVGLAALTGWGLRALLVDQPQLRRACVGMAIAGVLATLPSVATLPSHRLLGVGGVAAAGLLAVAIVTLRARAAALASAWRRRLATAIWAVHVPLAAATALVQCAAITALAQEVHAWDDGPALADAAGRVVVPVVAPDLAVGMYPAYARKAYDLPRVAGWLLLTAQRPGLQIRRLDARTLQVQSWRVPLFGTLVEGLLAAPDHLPKQGEVRDLGDVVVTIDSADATGVRELRFTFDRPLEDRHWLFVAPTQQGWQPWAIPAVGESWRAPQWQTIFGVPPEPDAPN